MKDKKNKGLKTTLIILAVIVVILAGYIVFVNVISNKGGSNANGNSVRPPFRAGQNFSLTGAQQSAVIAFFQTSPTVAAAQTYCAQNRINCFYYCRQLNSTDPICSQIMRPGNYTGNFTRFRNYTGYQRYGGGQ